ncbi:MAG TPA: aspartate aminotransferase, partial [Lachnospiraceae bacterium]|nr:aspartate aminotransferase [Lachnospiraceae bacterium]HCR41513.1 aspartate aminotransferase [Lachnospiraceae bacterium]
TGPQDSVFAMNQEFNKRRDYMYERVSNIKYISALKPQGAFYLFVDISEILDREYKGSKVGDVANLAKILIEEYNVAVIPCVDFGFCDHIRLSYAISLDQIKKGLDRMEDFTSKLV